MLEPEFLPQTTDGLEVGFELSLIIPTFNERDNIVELVNRLRVCLQGVAWEAIFVDDDSPDGTADVIRSIARTDRRVRCLQRLGRRGLSSACIEGMLASAAPYVAVMDADLQHDETLLPRMLQVLQQEKVDVVVGSRYIANGSIGQWSASRAWISRFATWLGRIVLHSDLADSMSGFFMIRRDILHSTVRQLSAVGFKLLLDLFVSAPRPLRYQELPYVFRPRHAGASKLDSQVAWDYVMLLLDKLVGHIIPVRFLTFMAVGGLGVGLHVLILLLLFQGWHVSFTVGQAVATLLAMTSNFLLNNVLTYRDRRLKGWRLLQGWLSFILVCSVGAVANVGAASYLFRSHSDWLLSALAGVTISGVWNYAVTAAYTWKQPAKA
jgi:dolichol-phosphate mannosyltransferase